LNGGWKKKRVEGKREKKKTGFPNYGRGKIRRKGRNVA